MDRIQLLNTTRIGQLTGVAPEEQPRVDFQGWPLLHDTAKSWGVLGVDLGANTEHVDTENNNKLFFFFGDVRSDGKQPGNADLVAWTDDTEILRHGGHLALGWNFVLPNKQQGATNSDGQPDWRFCGKCHGLFWAPGGDATGTTCPRDSGNHDPKGWIFVLPNAQQGAPLSSGQANWSHCDKCDSLFYLPDVAKSVCPKDGGNHSGQGSWNFILPNKQQGASDASGQPDWRYCNNCKSLFWDGDSYKGVCPGAPGGGITLHPVLNKNGIFDPFVGEAPVGLTLSDETPNGAFSFNNRVYVFAGFPDPFWKWPSDPPRAGDPGFGCFLLSKAAPEIPSNPDSNYPNFNPVPPNPYRKEFLLSPQRGYCPHDDRRDRLDPHDVLGLHFVLPHDVPASLTQEANWRHCQKCETLFFDGIAGNRGACHKGGQHEPVAQGLNYALPHDVASDAGNQDGWRQCVRCMSLVFWDGRSELGFCAAGGQHLVETTANNYVLPNDYAEDGHNQSFWYLCGKCLGLYWGGNGRAASVCPKDHGPHDRGAFNRPEFNYLLPHDLDPDSAHVPNFHFCGNCGGLFYDSGIFLGACPNGGTHNPQGYNFALASVGAQDSRHQLSWRICEKCAGVFFDGFADKGICPKGGGHAATPGSANFVLTHGPSGAVDPDWRFCGKCHGLVKVGQEEDFPFPAPFVINNAEHRLLWPKSSEGKGVVIINYDFRNFRLAWMPLFDGQDPRYDSIWYYHKGRDAWTQQVDNSDGYELFSHPTGKYTHVSTLWLPELQHWIVLYGTADEKDNLRSPILARVSRNLRDWSEPEPIFDPTADHGSWLPPKGWPYGAFALERFTRANRWSGSLTLTYLMSPAKPYQVQLMQSALSILAAVAPRRLIYGGSGTAAAGQALPLVGVFYGIADDGLLRWYRYNGGGQADPNGTLGWDANSGNAIGNGWDSMVFVGGGGNGVILAVDQNGDLLWYGYHGSGEDDASGNSGSDPNNGNPIGNGWDGFKHIAILPPTDPSAQIQILGVQPDGQVLWYGYAGHGEADRSGWDANSSNVIRAGWQNFLHVHGSGNVVFAVAENGDLLWHRYNGTGVADPNGVIGWDPNSGNPIGNGWQGFRQLYGGISDEGGTIGHVIYGVTTDGDVFWYRYEGNGEADRSGNTGWHPNSGALIRRGW